MCFYKGTIIQANTLGNEAVDQKVVYQYDVIPITFQ